MLVQMDEGDQILFWMMLDNADIVKESVASHSD
jgi:hypothetical protein